jgi:hypothetical protein
MGGGRSKGAKRTVLKVVRGRQSTNVRRPLVDAWIWNPEVKVMAGKMPTLHSAGRPTAENYSFDLVVVSEVSFRSFL